MLKEDKKKYMHIYMDVSEEIIYFHSTSTPSPLGKCLLDFLYADLNKVYDDPDYLIESHPYFWHWSYDEVHALVSKNVQDNQKLSIDKLSKLQITFRELLDAFVHGLSELNQDATHYFSRHPFYSSATLVNQTVKNENRWMVDYFLVSFEECLMCEFMEMIRRRQMIKVCKNCNRLFVAKRSNVEYCTRYYTDDGKTCADVGYTKTFEKVVQKDELLQAYTRAYKAHYARMTKPRKKAANMTRDEFEAWYKEAKQGLELARLGKIDSEAYKEWLKK